MRGFRTYTAGIVAAAALLAATGCGGSTNGSGAGGDASGIVPASVPVFVSIDTDLSSGQWSTAQSLLDEFPGKDQLLTQLQQSFEKSSNGVTWDDVKAALGPEVDIAVLDLGQGSTKSADAVGLTQPSDPSKFDALLQKGNGSGSGKVYTADYKGWTIFSDQQANLETFKQEADTGPALADDASYKDASGKLPSSALVKAYANGTKLTAALQQRLQALNATTQQSGKLDWIAADLNAQSDGLAVDAYTKSEGTGTTPAPYTAKLPDEVPAGALVYVSFNGSGLTGARMDKATQGLGSIPQAAELLPILKQLGPIFGHENALYVRPGAGIPEVTLIAQPDSPQQGLAAIDRLVATLGKSAGANAKPQQLTIGTVKATALNLGRFSLYYGALGGRIVVTDTQQAFQDLQSSGQKLADDPTFKEAEQAAGMPSQTNGFVYVDLKDSIPLVESLARLGGAQIPANVTANLQPLRTMLGWTSAQGGEGRATLFLEIK